MPSVDRPTDAAQTPGRHLDDDSRAWLQSLGSGHEDVGGFVNRDQAIARLHALLLRAARAELRRRGGHGQLEGPERDDLAHQAAADALVAILAKIGQFRGDSRFTTWAYKFVVLEVSAKLGRHFWRRPAAAVPDDAWERIPARFGTGPVEQAQGRELAGALRGAVDQALSERQRRVFVAILVDGVPLDALVVELGSTRNAIYKTMFDARRKVRAHLVADGYLTDDTSRTS